MYYNIEYTLYGGVTYIARTDIDILYSDMLSIKRRLQNIVFRNRLLTL